MVQTAVQQVIGRRFAEGSGGGGGCFRAGTRVMTPNGNVPIETIKKGDAIYAFDEQGAIRKAVVTETHYHEKEKVLRVGYWDTHPEACLYITGNHWVLDQYNAFIEIGKLSPDVDTLVDFRGGLRPIKYIEEFSEEPVYNLTVEPYHTYIADGIRVHNGGGGKKSSGSSARVPVESPNTLRSSATARVLDLIGEGPIAGLVNGAQSIFFDDTPLENSDGSVNFKGVYWEFRNGYPDQDPMSGFDEVETEQIVETEVTRQNGAVVRQISNADVNAARIRMRFPNMSFQDSSTGDLKPTSVELKIEVKPNNGDYRPVTFVYDEVNRLGNTTTGANCIGFRLVVKKRVLVKLNSIASVDIEARYRKTTAPTWTGLGRRTIRKIISNVPTATNPDGYIDGQPAYYYTFTTSYVVEDTGANDYEVGLVDGGEIISFVAYQKANLVVEGKNTSPTEKSYRFSLPGKGPWLLRVSRVTADSDRVNLQNSTFWAAYTEIIEEKFIYPDSAYIGLAVNSELFGNRIPSRAYDVYGREIMVPANYNPVTRTYAGFWDGTFRTAWSDNPAWCFMDMVINDRFGLGHRITVDQIDTGKLYEIAQYCDELVPDGYGGLEPRFTLNCVLNTRTEAYQLLNTLVSVFRGMVFWGSNTVGFGFDAPRATDVIVGRANVINGHFTYSTSSDRARHNSILVTWNDPADADRPNIEVVEDNKDIAKRGLRQTDVYAFGCKSRGQANRFGKWILYTEKYETETVTYRAALDHLNVVPGMIAGIVDPSISGADFAGRTMSFDGINITLDREVVLRAGQNYEINVMDDTGKIQTRRIITVSGITTRNLQIASAFNPQPTKGKMWSITGTDVEPRQFRIVTIVEVEPHIFEVTGIEHNPSKFEYVDRDFKLEPVNYSLYTSGEVQPPINLDIVETLFKSNNQLRTRVMLSWQAGTDNRVFLYRVAFRSSNGGVFLQDRFTSDEHIDIDDIEPGTYDFYVYGVAAAGESPALAAEGVTILGKSAPPGDVQNLRAERQVNGVVLQWDVVKDLDLVGYEIRKGASWDTAEYVADIVGTSLFVALSDAQETTLLVRAKDQLGILSSNVSSIVSGVIAPDTPPVFTAVAQGDFVLFRWDRVSGIDNKYEIRRGISWAAAELIAESGSDELYVLDPQRETAYYWIRAKSTAGLYSEGSRVASAQRALIPDRNVILEYDNANDGGAGLYPGWTFDMEPGDDDTLLLSVNINKFKKEDNSGSILLEDGTEFLLENALRASYGEHYFSLDLGQTVRARNWLETNLVNIAEGGPTWDEWNYPWEALESQVTWLPLGDLSAAQLTKVIAWEREPLEEELYAFSMQDTTDDFRGIVTAAEEINVTYDKAKFENGAFVHDLTKISYDVSLDTTFTLYFKFHTRELLADKRIFAVLKDTGSGDKIEIGYDAAFLSFYCADSEGNRVDLPAVLNKDEDYLFIGFVQEGVKRILYYKSDKAYTVGSVEAAFLPLDNTFNKLYLYNAA
jgi:predicted phage tail protein